MKPVARPKCDSDAFAEHVRRDVNKLKSTIDVEALSPNVRAAIHEGAENMVKAVREDLGLPPEVPSQ